MACVSVRFSCRSIAIPYPSSNGRGLEAGQSRPSNTLYLRVRIGDIGDDLYAIFINDMSEQRRFEAVRRDFVTNVSHELKTPAGAIALLAETVTDAADDPDAVRYFSGRISKESARLTELVHHLIDLQKAQSPQSVIDARRISALDVARAAIAANQTQADSRHVDIPTECQRTVSTHEGRGAGRWRRFLGRIRQPSHERSDDQADKEAMQTAVKNLVENAIHYSPEHTTVAVGVGERDGKVTIRVVDQGIGIPAKSLDRIFERFYRRRSGAAPGKPAAPAWDWPSPSIASRIAAAPSPYGRARGRDPPSPSRCRRLRALRNPTIRRIRRMITPVKRNSPATPPQQRMRRTTDDANSDRRGRRVVP